MLRSTSKQPTQLVLESLRSVVIVFGICCYGDYSDLAGRQRLIVLLLTLCCAAYLQQPDEATIEAAVFLTLRYLVLTVLSLAEYHPCLHMLTFADEATLRTLQDGVPLFLDLLQ